MVSIIPQTNYEGSLQIVVHIKIVNYSFNSIIAKRHHNELSSKSSIVFINSLQMYNIWLFIFLCASIMRQNFFVEEYVMKCFCLIINPCYFTVINFLLSDQSVPLTVLHGDGAGGHHNRVVRHQHASNSNQLESLPRM